MIKNKISASGPTSPVIAAQPSTGGIAPEARRHGRDGLMDHAPVGTRFQKKPTHHQAEEGDIPEGGFAGPSAAAPRKRIHGRVKTGRRGFLVTTGRNMETVLLIHHIPMVRLPEWPEKKQNFPGKKFPDVA